MLPVKVVKVRLRLLLLLAIIVIIVVKVSLSAAANTGTTTCSTVLPESLFLTLLVLVGLVAHPVAPDVKHPNVRARPSVDAPATLPVVHLHAEAVTPVEAVVPDVGLDLEPATVLATGGRRRLRGLQLVVDGWKDEEEEKPSE